MASSSTFRMIQEFTVEYTPQKVTQYESQRTGLRVAIVDREGPKVYGQLVFATEILDHSGSPHTLEHLCFLGSKNYPYRSMLDRLAERAYARGTNAWTSTDQTVYTLDTVGWEPFAQLLPVYLDSVLLPLLTDAACLTEVHHIDGSGHDAGVVYAEMQSYQNEVYDLIDRCLQQTLYPQGNGYHYETGGRLMSLRSLTADRIRQFHKQMYYPKNLRIVLTGHVDHDQLLRILEDFETSVLPHVNSPPSPLRRPFIDSETTPPLANSILDTIEFPEADESVGHIAFAFLGPKYGDSLTGTAIVILLSYLCDTKVSILRKIMVEQEQLCGDIDTETRFRLDMMIRIELSAVSTPRLSSVQQRTVELLRKIATDDLDLPFIRDCIARRVRQHKLDCEEESEFLANDVVLDHSYGNRDGSDLERMRDLNEYNTLNTWTEQQWRDLMLKWLVDASYISVIARPSARLAKSNEQEETARVEAQKTRLGKAGLDRLAAELEQAKRENDQPFPDHLYDNFPDLDVSSVRLVTSTTARAGRARQANDSMSEIQGLIDQDEQLSLPGYLHFEHVPSNFVNIHLFINTSIVPTVLKPLLNLYEENFFATPVMRHGQKYSYEDVSKALQRETVGYYITSFTANPEQFQISFQIEPDKYESLVGWLRSLLFDAVLEEERLLSSLAQLRDGLPEAKRNTDRMAGVVTDMLCLTRGSLSRATNVLSKDVYLKRVKAMLTISPGKVLADLGDLTSRLHQSDNFRILVTGDLYKIQRPVSTWQSFFDGLDTTRELQPLDRTSSHLSDLGRSPRATCHIVPIAASDSSAMSAIAKGIDSYQHPDFPALVIATEYLSLSDCPLSLAVRGQGLAYGSAFRYHIDRRSIEYKVWSSPDAAKVLVSSRDLLRGIANGDKIDPREIEAAVRQVVISQVDKAETMGMASFSSFVNQAVRELGTGWSKTLLERVRGVSSADVRRVIGKYLLPCFDPATSIVVCTCATVMEKDLMISFKKCGYEPEVHELSFYEDDYDLAPVEGEDDMSSDGEDGVFDEDGDGSEEDSDETASVGDDEGYYSTMDEAQMITQN